MFKESKKPAAMQQKSSSASELVSIIDKLQKNADEVEKNIYDIEEDLNKDVSNINEGKQPLYQDDINKRILNSLELLDGLDEDARKTKRLQHPQAEMIEQDMFQLRERVMRLKEDYEQIYHWGNIVEDKMESLNNKGFGQDLSTVEREVEEHNIFHSEVEALAPCISTGGDKEYISSLQTKYNKLLASSSARQRHLLTLRDYMQRCTNELFWMDQQAVERFTYDWSDANLDYPARQRQYENFISECLETKEATITRLNDDGQSLVTEQHPGKNAIEAFMEVVHADWKEYLSLLVCEENHLKQMDEYHKFHMEASDTQDLLKRLDTEVSQKYNPEFKDVHQLESLISELDEQAKAVDHFDEQIEALKKRSVQVLPLKYRRETPQKLLSLEALCDFDTLEGQILRGEKYTLLRNNGTMWDVKDMAGHKITAPGVCFLIPPTDPEAVAISDNLVSQQKAVKQKMASSKLALQKRYDVLKTESGAGLATAPPVSNIKAFWKSKKDDPWVYPVTEASYRNRVALMITNKEFSDETMNRRGAEKDEENMEKLLSSLGYEVVKYQNLTGKGIDDAVKSFSKHPKLEQTDSVFVIIMSHGEEGKILGVDWKQNNRDEFLINNIFKRLGPVSCRKLINKPKVIIIQACRGGGTGGVMIHSDDLNTANDVSDHETFESDFIHVHKEKDFIALHSSTHDTRAYRSPKTGSVLIKNIKEVFRPELFQKHILELFTEVMRKVSEFSHEDELQMPTMDRNTLTKSFYLFQGLLDNSH